MASGYESAPAAATSRAAPTTPRDQRAGELFVPFVKLQEHAANFLTNSALDPDSRIPEYKVCAVRMDKVGEDRGATRRQPIETVASSLIR